MRMKVMASSFLFTAMLLAPQASSVVAQEAAAQGPATGGQQIPSNLRNPKIDVQYVSPKNSDFQPIYERVKNRKVLETLQAFLAPLNLPDRLLIKTDECGPPTDFAKPPLPAVICYEYIQKIEELAPADKTKRGVTRADTIAGAFVMSALHETSRAVFATFKIPVWGRQEDAADKLTAYILVEMGEDVALRMLTGTASFFEASKATWNGSGFDMADVTSPEQQRYYNYLCMAYGSNPDLFQDFVRRTLLTVGRDRAQRCPYEYDKFKTAFENTIKPHVDLKLMEQVKKIKWLRADDGVIK
jgi:Putative metallopeptidase